MAYMPIMNCSWHLKLCVILGIPLFLFPGYNGKSKVPEFIYIADGVLG